MICWLVPDSCWEFLRLSKLQFYFPPRGKFVHNYCKVFQMQVLSCCSCSRDIAINLLYEPWETVGGVDKVAVVEEDSMMLHHWLYCRVTIGNNHPRKELRGSKYSLFENTPKFKKHHAQFNLEFGLSIEFCLNSMISSV